MEDMADSGTSGYYSAEPGLCPRSGREWSSGEWRNTRRCDLRKPAFGQWFSLRGGKYRDYERDKCWEFRAWAYFVSQHYEYPIWHYCY